MGLAVDRKAGSMENRLTDDLGSALLRTAGPAACYREI